MTIESTEIVRVKICGEDEVTWSRVKVGFASGGSARGGPFEGLTEMVVLMYPENPSRLVKVTMVCKLPAIPGEKVRASGFADTVKSGPVTIIVRLVL